MTAGNTYLPLKADCYITTGYANIALGGFICGPGLTALYLFILPIQLNLQLKIKRECAGNGAGKGKPQTGRRGEYQAAEGILGLAGTWENPS